jgi:hypothetical protein
VPPCIGLLKPQRITSGIFFFVWINYEQKKTGLGLKGNFYVYFVNYFNLCLLSFLKNLLLIVFSFSGPAHILCLIVASGWNKERCIPEIEIKITLIETISIVCVFVFIYCTYTDAICIAFGHLTLFLVTELSAILSRYGCFIVEIRCCTLHNILRSEFNFKPLSLT